MTRLNLVAMIAVITVLIFGDQTVRVAVAALLLVYLPIAVRAIQASKVAEAASSAYRFAAAQLDQKRSHRPSHGADQQPPEAQ